jgi:nucleoside-diphosphate-sugar epimerase
MPTHTSKYDRILVSGGSGAIGAAVLRQLMQQYPQAEVVCVLRNSRSLERLSPFLEPSQLHRVRSVYVDLASDGQTDLNTAGLEKAQRCLAVHCAADVSWSKSERLLLPINVRGTERFADLALAASEHEPALIFLSTAFIEDGKPFRNAYEKTKLAAEALLQERFGARMQLGIVRCSLVVGSSTDGEILRFNGLYPLIRVVALAEVPCVIADPSYQVDTVPVDYVVAQIVACAQSLGDDCRFLSVVAATGSEGSLFIGDLVQRIASNANSFRAAIGADPLQPVSVIPQRQFRFLMRAAKSWEMAQRFSQVERISEVMSGYVVHGASGRAIRPGWLGSPAPAPASYIDTVIRYWLERNHDRVAANKQHSWQIG